MASECELSTSPNGLAFCALVALIPQSLGMFNKHAGTWQGGAWIFLLKSPKGAAVSPEHTVYTSNRSHMALHRDSVLPVPP